MAEFKELALQYAAKGLAVFPLKRKKKTPVLVGGFKNATTNPLTINELWDKHPFSNIGIACGAMSGNLLVIDLDIKEDEGIDGRESLRDWEAVYGSFPETVTAVTGSGGQHLYYRVHKEYRPKVGIIPGVDIRCDGSYVVAPGSMHENGNKYYWDISLEDMEIAEANDAVIALLEKEDAVAEAEAFQMPAIIEKGQRVNALFHALASLQAKGLSDNAIKAAIRAQNDDTCNPPLTEEELQKEVFPALKRYKKGEWLDAFPLPGSNPEKKDKLGRLKPLSATELMNMELPPINFRVQDWLTDGVTMLCAKSKEGKSWMCLQMAVDVARGTPFMGYPTQKSDVIYFDFENGEQLSQDRLKKVLHGKPAPEGLHMVYSAERFGRGFKEQLEWLLEDYPNTGLIILDVLQHIRYLKDSKQSDYDCDYNTITELKELCAEHPMAIVCVHHLKKAINENDPFDNILGSTALMGASDATMILSRHRRSDPAFTISVTGRTLKGGDFQAVFNKEKYEWSIAGEIDELMNEKAEYERHPVVRAVRMLLAEQNEWQGTASDVADHIRRHGLNAGFGEPIGEKSVGKYLSSLEYKLMAFDGIEHAVKTRKVSGRSTRLHVFSRVILPQAEEDTCI